MYDDTEKPIYHFRHGVESTLGNQTGNIGSWIDDIWISLHDTLSLTELSSSPAAENRVYGQVTAWVVLKIR